MIRRLDAWIGKRVMQPPIIWICQRAGINQYAFYRYGWWLVALHALAFTDRKHWGWLAFNLLFAIGQTVNAGLRLNAPTKPSYGLRTILWALWLLNVTTAIVLDSGLNAGTVNLGLALVAEYAATITTIPPRKTEERARKLKLARLGA